MFLVLLLILFFVTYLISIVVNQLRQCYLTKHIPGPPIIPIVGNALEFPRNPQEILPTFLHFINKYGSTIQIWLGSIQVILTTDLKIVESILISSEHITKTDIYKFLRPWFGDGLVTSTGQKWFEQRKLLTPAFHFRILDESVQIFSPLAEVLIKNLEKHVGNEEFNIESYIKLYVLDVICETAMGVKINAQTNPNSKYVHSVRTLNDTMTQRSFSVLEQSDFIFNNFTKNGKIHNEALKIVQEMTNNVILERKLALAGKRHSDLKIKFKSFLDILLDCMGNENVFENSSLRDEVNTFMAAGYETVSTTALFVIHLLANHPIVQNKLYKEVEEVFRNYRNNPPTILDLNKLKYLDAIIRETLRLYPPVPFLGRHLKKDLITENLTIPAGRDIGLFAYAIHHDPKNFPNPEDFIPERFLDENIANNNCFSFLPFSAGPRNCIGQKFAMYELKFMITKIIQQYELLSAGPQYKIKLIISGILRNADGIFVKIKLRNVL